MSASYLVEAKKDIANAKAAFCGFGEIEKVVVNGIVFAPEQVESGLVLVASNWGNVDAFAVSRINGHCELRVSIGRRHVSR